MDTGILLLGSKVKIKSVSGFSDLIIIQDSVMSDVNLYILSFGGDKISRSQDTGPSLIGNC